MEKIITKVIGNYLNAMSLIAPKIAGRHGFNIFCHPYRVPLKDYHNDFLNTAERFSFIYDGLKIQGYKWGKGPKNILFVHGWKSHSFRWKNYIQALPVDEYTMYAIDAPGHGNSEGKFLNVVYYSECIRQVIDRAGSIDTVVSHSIGSFSMLYLLHNNPRLPINKLAVLSPPGNAKDFVGLMQKTLRLTNRAVQTTLNHFITELKKPIDYFSTERFAQNIKLPGLIIHDRGDIETPHENATKVHEAWQNSILISTEGLGHNLKSPEVVNVVKEFIINSKIQNQGKLISLEPMVK